LRSPSSCGGGRPREVGGWWVWGGGGGGCGGEPRDPGPPPPPPPSRFVSIEFRSGLTQNLWTRHSYFRPERRLPSAIRPTPHLQLMHCLVLSSHLQTEDGKKATPCRELIPRLRASCWGLHVISVTYPTSTEITKLFKNILCKDGGPG